MNVARTLPTIPRSAIAALTALAIALTTLVVAAPASSGADQPGAPVNGTASFLESPMTVDPQSPPTFRWQLPDDSPQTAYQVTVSAAPSDDIAWDSGKVEGSVSEATYAGGTLDESQRYAWRVRTWNDDDIASAWSTPATFGTSPDGDWSDAQTIWAAGPQTWGGDFDLRFRAQFVQKHVTVAFRAENGDNFYLWQFRGDGVNELAVHRKVDGDSAPAVLKTAPLGVSIANGDDAPYYTIRLVAEGNRISTYLDGELVDRTVDDTFSSGGFGFYSGGTESYRIDDVLMTNLGGDVLYDNSFDDTAYNDFGCGELTGSELYIPNAQRAGCVYYGPWSDYDVDFDLTIAEVAVGVMFRGQDGSNNLMWQIRGDNSRIVPHTRVNGSFTALSHATVSPAIGIGTTNHVKVAARGNDFTTYINGVEVDKRTVAAPALGSIGFRTGRTESGTVSNITVTTPHGDEVYRADPQERPRDFPCLPVNANGDGFTVPRSADCLRADSNAEASDWAFLRTEFDVADKPVAWATLYATASSTSPARQYVHRVLLNGEFVGIGPAFPVDDEHRFDGWDVTTEVRSGETNAIGVIAHATSGRQFLATLVVGYEDGTRSRTNTSTEWTSLPEPTEVYPDAGSVGTQYFSAPVENLQAGAYPFGFAQAGFDDTGWDEADARPALVDLAGSSTANVVEELHAPERIVEKAPGHYFIDFGRTWIGGVRLDLDGGTGQTVEIRYGEELTDRTTTANTVRWQMRTGNNFRDRYTLAGNGESLQNWGFRVFRYVEIIGAPEPITEDTIAAAALVYPMSDDAAFSADDSSLEQVWELSRHTIDSQNLNAYADSWTRERAPYEADAFIQLQSHIYLDADPTLAEYSMDYLLSRRTWPTEWPMYLILGAHELWQSTGSAAFIEDNYDQLVSRLPAQYLEESTGLIRKTSGSNGCNSQTDCDIVDWPTSERDGYQFRQYNTVVNALAYRSYSDMADMAQATGRDSDAASFTSIAERMRDAMNEYLYDEDFGAYDDGMDGSRTRTGHHAIHASVFAQAFGVTPEAERERVGTYLADRGMQCSVYCAPFLLQALYDGNQGDAAFDLLTSTGQRSWMNMIALGAGATMEAWDPALKSNTTFSHPWASSPAFMIPRGVFGIRSIDPGYSTFSVKIQPGSLTESAVTVPTVRGEIRAAFATEADEMLLGLHVPEGSTAHVSVPVASGEIERLYVDNVAVDVEVDNGYAVINTVDSGCHVISSDRVADAASVAAACPAGFDVDTTAPTVAMSIDGPAADPWISGDATILLEGQDDESGVAAVEYRVDGNTWASYSAPLALEEGLHTVEARATDHAGNVSPTVEREVGVDASSPTTTATTQRQALTSAGTSPVEVTLEARDELSGPATTQYRISDGEALAYDGPFIVTDPGTHDVDFWSVDAVGNTEDEQTLRFYVDGSTAAPARGTLSADEGWDTGLSDGSFVVTMNLWWGMNATEFDLYQDDALVATVPLDWGGRDAQSATHEIEGLPNGAYTFHAVLRNASGESTTAPLTVSVANAAPGTPTLSHDNHDRDGNYTVTANLWWGTNATAYRFFEDGELVEEGTLEAATPSAQHAAVTVADREPGTHLYNVEFENAAGITSSKTLKVVVK
ncbi:family 78 glycoside hydrolase catalytic domain [Demequina sp. NBRC 110051]|uniref:family 78 glycoside hydrolase catalytic domain n=1 Tax=Demequina sp. NBRC 110051 TaxID=1570340 RepID=UPI0009FD51E6|nr:family 78 glycoside hydrolase catalytic domain [Demequina sp. NBRC 110051]